MKSDQFKELKIKSCSEMKEDIEVEILLISKSYDLDQILISATRADENSPMSFI